MVEEDLRSDTYKDEFILYKRNGGCGVVCGDKLYVWGGECDRPMKVFEFLEADPIFRTIKEIVSLPEPEPPQEDDEHYYCTIDEYDLKKSVWRHKITVARSLEDFPFFGRGCTMVEINGNLYVFAGYNMKVLPQPDGSQLRRGVFCNTVHCLNTGTFEWRKLDPVDNPHIPPPLYLCGSLGYYGKLCIFGGMTRARREAPRQADTRTALHLQDGAECCQYGLGSDKFWTNEYFEFDTKSHEWSAPGITNRPSPCGVMTFTRISDQYAAVYGGNYQNSRSDDLFIFDLEKKEFTASLKPRYPTKWPPQLTFHTATCLVNPAVVGTQLAPSQPPLVQKLLLLGGKDDDHCISNEIWILEIKGNKLIECKKFPPQAMQSTSWHIAQPYYVDGKQQCAVVVFGGNAYVPGAGPGGPRDAVNTMKFLEFGVASLQMLCLKVIYSSNTDMDTDQFDFARKQQMQECTARTQLKNSYQMFSIPLLL